LAVPIDPNAVAGINATIITIAVAVVSFYAAGTLQAYETLVSQLIAAADRFRMELQAMFYGWNPSEDLQQKTGGQAPKKLLEILNADVLSPVAVTLRFPQLASQRALSIEEKAHLAENALYIFDLLVNQFPFHAARPLNTLEEARKWAAAVRELEFQVYRASDENTLQELAEAYAQIKGKEYTASKLQRIDRATVDPGKLAEMTEAQLEKDTATAESNYTHALEWYLGELRRAVAVAGDLRRRFAELRTFTSRLPRKRVVFIGLVSVGFTFILGVVVPLASPASSKILWLWIPMILYIAGFSVLVARVVVRYPQPDPRDLTDAEAAWRDLWSRTK
jgi:hypothetical protein